MDGHQNISYIFGDVMDEEIIAIVEYPNLYTNIHPPFNCNFIANIPKCDTPQGFDRFFHGKMWQYPRKSMDIATSKCFFSRGNNSVAIEMTPNLRRKSDNVLYFVRCLSRRYIHAWPSLYPRLAVAVSTLCIRF